MNEREVKERARQRHICSVTGNCCRCGDTGRCESRLGKPSLDEIPTETVRQLRTARLYIQAATHALDDIEAPYELSRRYPCPETREIRRKLTTAIAMIDEVGGDL